MPVFRGDLALVGRREKRESWAKRYGNSHRLGGVWTYNPHHHFFLLLILDYYTLPIKMFGVCKMFERSHSWSPRQRLFDQNSSIWNIVNFFLILILNFCFLFEYFFFYLFNLFLWWQSWIFYIITPVFSITWSFRNHSNIQILWFSVL